MTPSFFQTISSGSAAAAQTASRLAETAVMLYNANLIPLEIFSVLVSAGIVAGIVAIIIRTGWLSVHVDRVRDVVLKTDMPKKRAQAAWATVQKHLFSGNANDLKMAVVQADNILNDALQYAGVRGANLGDRLKNIKRGQMPNIEEVWAAHKLRNEIAHETNFILKHNTAEQALEAFEAALKNLGVFDEENK
jgi:hypothetical protein